MAGLYVHIPFCHTKCLYCDFYSLPGKRNFNEVITGIISEYRLREDEIKDKFESIYIGGGTPSILPEDLISELMLNLPVDSAEEITIEVNPEDVNENKVRTWKSLGINRVSIGIQSLDNQILKRIGRRHSSEKALEAIKTIQDSGIRNISVDLIYGLPGLTSDKWEKTLNSLIDTGIKHISAYCLTFYENTPLYKLLKQGKITEQDDDNIAQQFDILRKVSQARGFEHYEISNLAIPGYESRHNSIYWRTDGKWLGIGPAAHSFDGKIRRIDKENISEWMASFPRPFNVEPESEIDIINDFIVGALRTTAGLDLSTLESSYADIIRSQARRFINSGELELNGDSLRIIPDKWLISDFYIREIML